VEGVDIPQTTPDESVDQSLESVMLTLDAREIVVAGKLT
jgi:hypothetical protein